MYKNSCSEVYAFNAPSDVCSVTDQQNFFTHELGFEAVIVSPHASTS